MKKKTTPLTQASKEEDQWLLPIIRIVSTEDEVFTKLELEMEDSTHDMLVKWGKEVASDEDYISIAISHGLEEYLESIDDKSDSD
jgi:hypothetical protein